MERLDRSVYIILVKSLDLYTAQCTEIIITEHNYKSYIIQNKWQLQESRRSHDKLLEPFTAHQNGKVCVAGGGGYDQIMGIRYIDVAAIHGLQISV